jgi:hypothetical protein
MSRLHVPGRPRWTRTEAIVGMASLGLFYWGAVAALAGYRRDSQRDHQELRAVRCQRAHAARASLRGPEIVPLPSTEDWRGRFVRPEPAWAPYPQPRALGLAYGPADVRPVYELRRARAAARAAEAGRPAAVVEPAAIIHR